MFSLFFLFLYFALVLKKNPNKTVFLHWLKKNWNREEGERGALALLVVLTGEKKTGIDRLKPNFPSTDDSRLLVQNSMPCVWIELLVNETMTIASRNAYESKRVKMTYHLFNDIIISCVIQINGSETVIYTGT